MLSLANSMKQNPKKNKNLQIIKRSSTSLTMIIVMLCRVLIKIQMFALKKTPQIYGLTQAVAQTDVVAY